MGEFVKNRLIMLSLFKQVEFIVIFHFFYLRSDGALHRAAPIRFHMVAVILVMHYYRVFWQKHQISSVMRLRDANW